MIWIVVGGVRCINANTEEEKQLSAKFVKDSANNFFKLITLFKVLCFS